MPGGSERVPYRDRRSLMRSTCQVSVCSHAKLIGTVRLLEGRRCAGPLGMSNHLLMPDPDVATVVDWRGIRCPLRAGDRGLKGPPTAC